VYLFLHLYCDYSTGIYKGTALGIAYRMGDATHKSTINKSLARLKKIKFINFRAGIGKRGGYEILIDKFEPTFGELRGCRLNAWKSGANGRPFYEAGTVKERSRNGQGTVEARSGHGRGTVEERVPYLQTIQTGKQEYVHTSSDEPGDDDAATLPSLPPDNGTGKKNPVEPVPLAPLVSLDDNPPVTPTAQAATPPPEELADIRQWNTQAFEVPAERLRNCLFYVLDADENGHHYYNNDYYRRNPPTVASMGREKFIRLLDQNTPVGWTPDRTEKKPEPKKTDGLLNYKLDKPNFD
jgi:hypothetical protein